jgi:energy-coupling factor transport system permease protein
LKSEISNHPAFIAPRPRLAATAIATAATFVADRWPPLLLATAVLMILLLRAGLLKIYLKFLLAVLGPTAVMLMLVWGLVTRAPPGMAIGSNPRAGAEYALMVSLRLAVLGGVLQVALLSIPSRLLPVTLRGWGVRGEGMVVALGVFAVGPELALRAEQVLTARRARGLSQGGIWAKLREIPRLLRPLFVWSIRSAVHRSEAWEERALLLKVDQLPGEAAEFWPAGGAIAVVLSILWLALAIYSR